MRQMPNIKAQSCAALNYKLASWRSASHERPSNKWIVGVLCVFFSALRVTMMLLFNPLHSKFGDLISSHTTQYYNPLHTIELDRRWPPLPTPIKPTTSPQTHTLSMLRTNCITTRCRPGSVLTSGPSICLLPLLMCRVPCVILQAPPAPANLNGQHHPEGYREDIVQPIVGDVPGRMQDPH